LELPLSKGPADTTPEINIASEAAVALIVL